MFFFVSATDLWRWWQADIPAVPHKLQQAGAATRTALGNRHAEMAALAPILRNPTAQPVAQWSRRESRPSWPSEQL